MSVVYGLPWTVEPPLQHTSPPYTGIFFIHLSFLEKYICFLRTCPPKGDPQMLGEKIVFILQRRQTTEQISQKQGRIQDSSRGWRLFYVQIGNFLLYRIYSCIGWDLFCVDCIDIFVYRMGSILCRLYRYIRV